MKREPFVCVLNKDCTVCNLEELHGEKGAFRFKKKKTGKCQRRASQ